MPIDYNIPLQARGPQFQTPFELMSQYATIQGQQGENQLTQRKLAAYDTADQQSNALAGLVKQNTDPATGRLNFAPVKAGMMGLGMGKEALEMEGSQADIELKQLEQKSKLYEHVGQVLGGYVQLRPEQITPEIEARYQNDVAQLHQVVGAKLDIPDQLDIPTLQVKFQQGMSAKDQNAARMAELAAQTGQYKDERDFNYRQQHDTQSLAMQQRGQDISQANRQQDFDQRERSIEATRINKPLSPQQQKAVDATEMQALAAQAEPLLSKTTASGIGASYDEAAAYLGGSSEGADAAAKLAVIGANMVSKIPKPPGAQSEAELKEAQRAAGRIADPSVPESQKRAALQTILEITDRQIARQNALGTAQPAQPAAQAPITASHPDGRKMRSLDGGATWEPM